MRTPHALDETTAARSAMNAAVQPDVRLGPRAVASQSVEQGARNYDGFVVTHRLADTWPVGMGWGALAMHAHLV